MKLIKAIIVDDEKGNVETLHSILIQFCKNVVVCGTANTNDEAKQLIYTYNPDLVFLDIQLQNETSFQLLKNITNINFEIIFITAYNQFAINAIKYAAIDYLLKPVNIDELKNAVFKASLSIEKKDSLFKIQHLLSNLSVSQAGLKKIGIVTLNGIVFKEVDSIVRLKAEGNYTRLFYVTKEQEVSSRSLKDYEDILPKQIFCRIHNAHLINLHYIKKYTKGRGGIVIMEDDSEIEVSQRKKAEFIERINNSF